MNTPEAPPLKHLLQSTSSAIRSIFAGDVAVGAPVARVAQAHAAERVAAAVLQVTVAPHAAAVAPPARLALAQTGARVAPRQVTLAGRATRPAPVVPPARAAAAQLVAADAQRAGGSALAPLGAGGRPPALLAAAVAVDGVAAAVPAALAGVLAQRPPAVGVAGALAGERVAAAVRVARARLAAVWSPEVRRTTSGRERAARNTHMLNTCIQIHHWSAVCTVAFCIH